MDNKKMSAEKQKLSEYNEKKDYKMVKWKKDCFCCLIQIDNKTWK